MATVYKKRGKYQVDYSDAAGSRKTMCLPRGTTKGEASRLAGELEHKVTRQRHGFEEVPNSVKLTLSELCQWWLTTRCKPASLSREKSRFKVQIQEHKIGGLQVSQVDVPTLESHFEKLEKGEHGRKGLSGSSINSLRSRLGTVFRKARKAKKWLGASPIDDTERRDEDDIQHVILAPAQADALLRCLSPEWRGLFATAFFTGMRKGELFGILKKDVDLVEGTMTIRRSHEREQPKNKKIRKTPIPAPLLPFIEAAMESKGSVLFPNAQGKQRAEGTNAEVTLRRALARAGIVTGYSHICRRKGCGTRESHPDAANRKCAAMMEVKNPKKDEPKEKPCGFSLWASPQPLPMKFHDLRHSTNTMLVKHAVPDRIIQKIMGHLSKKMTDVYTTLDLNDMRDAMSKLRGEGIKATPTGAMEAFTSAAPASSIAGRFTATESPLPVARARKIAVQIAAPVVVPETAIASVSIPALFEAPGGPFTDESPQSHCHSTAAGVVVKRKAPDSAAKLLKSGALIGAEHQVRTGDLRLGKATLYQLS
jgi:integrase